MFTIGVDVGGTKTAYGLFDESGALVEKCKRATDHRLEAEAFFYNLAQEIRALMHRHALAPQDIRGIGIGLPSFIEFEKGYLVKTSNMVNLKQFPARDYLQGQLPGIPIVLDNDGNAAALAEHRYGAGRGFRHMLYCPVSTGISSAMIIDGKLFRGSYGFAGESGHQIATPGEGLPCGCGNRGCFMSYVSGSMIVRHVRERIAQGEETAMIRLAGGAERITAEHIVAAYDLDDPLAKWAVAQMAKYMAVWLFNLYVTLNINCFVLGGGLLMFGDRLFPEVRRQFDQYNQSEYPVYFKKAELGEDFGIIGAMLLLDQVVP
ncbi:MAG: ROK family protein [Oscillospiraceae bacterium]|jgi:glucokinase|nr:ROK family protein [Oscillospiraceae bacterium]